MNNHIYRRLVKSQDLVSFHVQIKESDLLVLSERKLVCQTEEALLKYREDIERYIYYHPLFRETFEPFPPDDSMPPIVRCMSEASQKAGVGPMASVAGAIAEFVGKDLLNWCKQVIVENGGDIFMKVTKKRKVGVYAGPSPLSGHIALQIEPEETPIGICCSAGSFGHSRSFGKADAVVILSSSTPLADAVATAVGNLIKEEKDIKRGLKFLKNIPEVRGGLIIKNKKLGAWGKLNIVRD
ncbi:MAG TPA: UPF0280 family protein [Candidatus Aerophobetes bacterium]|uniref:UPF0280 family protein n=1 Tax=Aerophobetes bacterium TaxID=2030807 RepID=A0A662DFM1_UNCAE|nr:MAG: UPF0280 family protein [Candidatus Aerophobetes bacterium]HDN84515.1 UPF0280 family protein [Candidatus Aerophobetes bacterium]